MATNKHGFLRPKIGLFSEKKFGNKITYNDVEIY